SKDSPNWNLWGNSVGARDFSPDWKHRYFGTEVPCPDNDKHQFGEFLEIPKSEFITFFAPIIELFFSYAMPGSRHP
ncbi:MAG: hypothetical protein IJO38_01515, partial [Akkermansia sp.]|nr:hypothetical protein [Akkermansia sp.]